MSAAAAPPPPVSSPVPSPAPAAPPDAAARRRRTRREVRAIAAVEALDGLRSRRQLVVRALTPILLFVCVLGITLGLRGADTRTHPNAYRVAVEGDYAGARHTLDGLNPERLELFPADDARVAAISGADAGMRVPDHLDDTLRDQFGTDVPIELYEITINPPSRAAAVLVQSGFVEVQKNRVRERIRAETGAAADQASPLTLDVVNVERTAAGTRSLTAQVVPGLLCLQAALLVAGTANRLVSRRTRGLLLAQLVLPVSRRALAFAKGLGELGVGLVTAVPVVAAVLAFGWLANTGGAGTAVVALVASVVTMLALFAMTTALGVVIGTAARTQEQVSLATGAAVIVATLIASTVALSDRAAPAAVSLVPFAGSVGALRSILDGAGSPVSLVVATASTLLGALALTAWAGRSLDAERMVMRNG